MKVLKEKGASPSIVGQPVNTYKKIDKVMDLLEKNPKITLEEYMVIMDIEE